MFSLPRYLPKKVRRRLRAIARRAARASCVLAALAGYGIACFGIPIARPSGNDLSQPFACAHRACGCINAEDCWKDCCCFSREQKLAWAVEHGVSVPAWVLNEKPRSCCQPQAVCHSGPTAPSCCTKPPQPKTTKWVLGMMARKCRGQGVDWLSAAAVLPAPPRVTWTHYSPCIGEAPTTNVVLPAFDLSPPTPPPRLIASDSC